LDDGEYVTHNLHVASGLKWKNIEWAFQDIHLGNWHPLTWISHMADAQIYQLWAGGHHLTNLLFHAANTVLLFLLFERLTSAFWRSVAIAALFALHPIHVESVAWIAERKDVLSTFFGLLALMAYVKYAQSLDRKNGWRWYAAALLLFSCALMSNPMLVTLPVTMLLLDFWPLRRCSEPSVSIAGSDSMIGEGERPIGKCSLGQVLWEKTPFVVLSIVACIVTFLAQNTAGAVKGLHELPLSVRIENGLVTYWRYIAKMAWPSNLAVFYPFPSRLETGDIVLAISFIINISLLAVVVVRRFPFLLFGWLWYLLTLIPVIGFIQTGMQAMADRYTYLPLIGIFVALVWGSAQIVNGIVAKRLIAVAWSLVILAALAAANHEARYWKSSETLFRRAAAVTEKNAVAYNCLGIALNDEGKMNEAIKEFQQAIQIRPDYNIARVNLARSLAQAGEPDRAFGEVQLVLQREPHNPEARLLCGNLLMHEGKVDEGIAQYEEAVRLSPKLFEAQNNLGNALQRKGQPAKAIYHYRAALEEAPTSAETHNNLAIALATTGNSAEAIAEYNAALHFKPDYAEAHYNLGNALGSAGHWDLALSNYMAAIKIRPQYPKALIALATVYNGSIDPRLRQPDKSLEMAKKANELTEGRDAVVVCTLAEAYAANGMRDVAGAAAHRALDLARTNGQTDLLTMLQLRLKSIIEQDRQ
jgi:tetratricopeptide (TPR) repeat protein